MEGGICQRDHLFSLKLQIYEFTLSLKIKSYALSYNSNVLISLTGWNHIMFHTENMLELDEINSIYYLYCILRHSEIWGAADEAVLNKVHKNKQKKSPCYHYCLFL